MEVWAENYPGANIGILPGLSDLIVIDNDDLEQDELVKSLCGPTPLTVRSNRGRHRYYRKPADSLPSNLRSGPQGGHQERQLNRYRAAEHPPEWQNLYSRR